MNSYNENIGNEENFMEADSASEEEERRRREIARKRTFFVGIAIGVILLVLLICAISESFKLLG